MRISGTYFSGDGTIYSVCNVITDTENQAGIDGAIKKQWPMNTDGVTPLAGVTAVALAPGATRTDYPAYPA